MAIKEPRDAEYYARYNYNLHSNLRTRYHRLTLFSAVLSAATSSTVLAATFQGTLAPVWQIVLALSTILAVIGPIMRWSDLQTLHGSLAMAYRQLEWHLPKLTLEQAVEELAKLQAQETHALPLLWKREERIADEQTCQQLSLDHNPTK